MCRRHTSHAFDLERRLRRGGQTASIQRDIHDTRDCAGPAYGWAFLVGDSVFKYNRPKVTTLRSSPGHPTVTAVLSFATDHPSM